MEVITSEQNPLVKEIKSLNQKKYRQSKKQFFIEGFRFVEEAVKEGVRIDKIVVSEEVAESEAYRKLTDLISKSGHFTGKNSFKVYTVAHRLFKQMSDTENPQGVLAVINAEEYCLEDYLNIDRSFFIILDSIQDPGNLGTIIRTADAAGATGVIMSKGCVDLYNSKVLRSTMGSLFHIPVFHSENLLDTINRLKERKVRIFGAHLKGTANHYEYDMSGSVGIIIGNEANGISDEVIKTADTLVKIPMPGRAESLNASVAAAILIYEVVRQRLSM